MLNKNWKMKKFQLLFLKFCTLNIFLNKTGCWLNSLIFLFTFSLWKNWKSTDTQRHARQAQVTHSNFILQFFFMITVLSTKTSYSYLWVRVRFAVMIKFKYLLQVLTFSYWQYWMLLSLWAILTCLFREGIKDEEESTTKSFDDNDDVTERKIRRKRPCTAADPRASCCVF